MADTLTAVPRSRRSFALFALLLTLILAVLFFRSFQPAEVVFSNDGPLGGLVAAVNRMPDVLFGAWHDINWLGSQSPTPAINLTSSLRLMTSPVVFAKIFPAVSLLFLGLGAWFCFRQMKLAPLACALGGLAATLSSHFLSTACWGVASQTVAFGLDFIALGLLFDDTSPRRWAKTILAGLAVGMNIMEAYDIGAIFSLYVAAFVCFQAFSRVDQHRPAVRIARLAMRVGVVAIFAGFLATEALVSLIGTQIKGIAGTEQTPEAKAARWDFATQWSFPKAELPRIVIPGLFGYRMDTPKNMEVIPSWFEGGAYWGKVGETPGWSDHHNEPGWVEARGGGLPRFSGGGEYAGVLVVAVALWAVLQSLRKKDSVFTVMQKKFIWFWAVAAFISVLLEFGRYAPFYQFVYMLPYFSTIRNPAKFTHPWSLPPLSQRWDNCLLCDLHSQKLVAESHRIRKKMGGGLSPCGWAQPSRLVDLCLVETWSGAASAQCRFSRSRHGRPDGRIQHPRGWFVHCIPCTHTGVVDLGNERPFYRPTRTLGWHFARGSAGGGLEPGEPALDHLLELQRKICDQSCDRVSARQAVRASRQYVAISGAPAICTTRRDLSYRMGAAPFPVLQYPIARYRPNAARASRLCGL